MVYCDREGPGAPARRRSAVPPGPWRPALVGRARLAQTRRERGHAPATLASTTSAAFPVQKTLAGGETANHVPPHAPPYRAVFLPAPRARPRNSGGRPTCRTATGPKRPAEASRRFLPKKRSGKTLAPLGHPPSPWQLECSSARSGGTTATLRLVEESVEAGDRRADDQGRSSHDSGVSNGSFHRVDLSC